MKTRSRRAGRAYVAPRLSPDGTRVALEVRDQESDIWVWDFARETLTRVTFDPGLEQAPTWMPDGRRMVFSSQAAMRGACVSLLASGRWDGHCGASDRESESDDAVPVVGLARRHTRPVPRRLGPRPPPT